MNQYYIHICGLCKKPFFCIPETKCHGNEILIKEKEICICNSCSNIRNLQFIKCRKADTIEEISLAVL